MKKVKKVSERKTEKRLILGLPNPIFKTEYKCEFAEPCPANNKKYSWNPQANNGNGGWAIICRAHGKVDSIFHFGDDASNKIPPPKYADLLETLLIAWIILFSFIAGTHLS